MTPSRDFAACFGGGPRVALLVACVRGATVVSRDAVQFVIPEMCAGFFRRLLFVRILRALLGIEVFDLIIELPRECCTCVSAGGACRNSTPPVVRGGHTRTHPLRGLINPPRNANMYNRGITERHPARLTGRPFPRRCTSEDRLTG